MNRPFLPAELGAAVAILALASTCPLAGRTTTLEKLWQTDGLHESTSELRLSPDGKQLFTAGTSRILRVWDTATGELLRTAPEQRCGIATMALSPDGTLAACSDRNAIRLLDPNTGDRLDRIKTGIDLGQLVFSPEGRHLAAGGGSRISLFRVVTTD